MPKLTRDIAAADNRDRLRHFVGARRFRRWSNMEHRAQDVAGGCRWPGRVCRRKWRFVDPESSVGGERGVVAIERDVLSKRLFEDAVVFFREVEGVAQNRIGIGSSHGRLEAKPPRVARIFGRVGVTDEQF